MNYRVVCQKPDADGRILVACGTHLERWDVEKIRERTANLRPHDTFEMIDRSVGLDEAKRRTRKRNPR